MTFFSSGDCFLANSCSASAEIALFLRHSSMNAMLFCRMLRLSGRQSACMAVASRPSSADCMRFRYAASEPRQVAWTIQIGNDHFGQRHGAVADGFEQLIDDRHPRRVDLFLGPISSGLA